MRRHSDKRVAESEWRKATTATDPDVSIDDLLKRGLRNIEQTLKHITQEAGSGPLSRESIMTLKDCMSMLHDLKKREQELLDNLSDEELAKIVEGQQK